MYHVAEHRWNGAVVSAKVAKFEYEQYEEAGENVHGRQRISEIGTPQRRRRSLIEQLAKLRQIYHLQSEMFHIWDIYSGAVLKGLSCNFVKFFGGVLNNESNM